MNEFNHHNKILRQHLDSIFEVTDSSKLENTIDLDGIDQILRQLLSIEEMRAAGSFFTGQELASEVVDNFNQPITFNSKVLDPTCGAGNLLIEVSRRLGVEVSLSETLHKWGNVLWGFDIHSSFIDACKLRLILEALRRGVRKDCSIEKALELLPNIMKRNAMEVLQEECTPITHVIMNPPFSQWKSPNSNYWKKGKLNAAAIVLDYYLRILPKDSVLSAILPEVLRSGSRYKDFRNFVSNEIKAKVKIWGRFNSQTDVDVFLLSGSFAEKSAESIAWCESIDTSSIISDSFDVRVGPLVAYRDPKQGIEYPFLHPKNAPNWTILRNIQEKRKFDGKVFAPPFVVVKRTSSPTDKFRAAATIVAGKLPVAVENHLIIIKPKSSTLKDCKKLMSILKSKDTNNFLNQRIRLRHLTVGVIKEIPIPKDAI